MILVDTHIWVWWVDNNPRLTQQHRDVIVQSQAQGLGVSIISCWEVVKLVELDKLQLATDLDTWLTAALAYPGVQLVELSVAIAVESTRLIGFHKDPADQMLVATARILGCPLLTADAKILNYSDVQTL